MTETVTITSMLTEAGTTMPAMLNLVWTLATANPLLTLITTVGVGSLGFTLFKRAKKTVK